MIVTLDKPGRSHHLGTRSERYGPIEREELYPIVVVTDIPRVAGEVRAELQASRYVSSSGWTAWQIILRNVDPSNGIGEKTWASIREACIPVIREWLASPDYAVSRQRAAANTTRRLIQSHISYTWSTEYLPREFATLRPELSDHDVVRFEKAIALLGEVSELLAPSRD